MEELLSPGFIILFLLIGVPVLTMAITEVIKAIKQK